MNSKNRTVLLRRKREGKTDYKKRLLLLKSAKLRLVVRLTNSGTLMQVLDYFPHGDKVLIQAHSKELKALGFAGVGKSIPATYLTGLLLAKKAKDAKVKEAILDIGLRRAKAGSRVFAAVKGVLDGGVIVPCDKTSLPSEQRVQGDHIVKFLESKELPKNQFSKYQKEKITADKFKDMIKTVKGKLV